MAVAMIWLIRLNKKKSTTPQTHVEMSFGDGFISMPIKDKLCLALSTQCSEVLANGGHLHISVRSTILIDRAAQMKGLTFSIKWI